MSTNLTKEVRSRVPNSDQKGHQKLRVTKWRNGDRFIDLGKWLFRVQHKPTPPPKSVTEKDWQFSFLWLAFLSCPIAWQFQSIGTPCGVHQPQTGSFSFRLWSWGVRSLEAYILLLLKSTKRWKQQCIGVEGKESEERQAIQICLSRQRQKGE